MITNAYFWEVEKKLVITADGSPTLVNEAGDSYKSLHGARNESSYVFIEAGLQFALQRTPVTSVFELGFGTGLNAFLTAQFAEKHGVSLHYTTVEAFPLVEEWKQLDFGDPILLHAIHSSPWEQHVEITPHFSLYKQKSTFADMSLPNNTFDVVYYDAFSPHTQPELWTISCFEKMYRSMRNEGVLVTYSVKGEVRRTMIQANFEVERMAGPPGKRHMLRAIKRA